MEMDRRQAIAAGLAAAAACVVPALAIPRTAPGRVGKARSAPLFSVSLAEWSLHRTLGSGEVTNLDFPRVARSDYGIEAIEYVNSFFKDKADDEGYLKELDDRCRGVGVRSLLIMVDGEGALGHADEAQRAKSVDNHRRWVRAAKRLGCHSIRVNAQSTGEYAEQQRLAADGLRRLTEYAETQEINVIVENHGGLSSNGEWLAGVMKRVDHPRCGTLPDFGNFCMDWSRSSEPDSWYDRYKGVKEMMPFAKAVSAKSHEFSDAGDEVRTDYRKMMRIVLGAGYRGYVGVEYEGDKHSEADGIKKTKALLERVREELASEYR